MIQMKPFRERVGFCGPATVKMVLEYYGVQKTERELGILMHSNEDLGTESEQMATVARELGLDARIQDESSFHDLEKLVLQEHIPVIVNWFSEDDGHYSVVVDLDSENIYMQDPEVGYLRAMRRSHFYRIWFDFRGDTIEKKEDLILRRMIVITKKA